MIRNINELRSFIVVAETGSFTKAGAKLGISTSALSHSIRKLEEQLKVKLFHRTTRSIATTEAGEQLFQTLLPLFESIEDNVNALSAFRDTLSGTLRINGADHSFLYAIWDKLFPIEQHRLVSLLIERIVVTPSELEVRLRTNGIERVLLELNTQRTESKVAA